MHAQAVWIDLRECSALNIMGFIMHAYTINSRFSCDVFSYVIFTFSIYNVETIISHG